MSTSYKLDRDGVPAPLNGSAAVPCPAVPVRERHDSVPAGLEPPPPFPNRRPSWTSIGRLAPLALAVWMAAEIVPRFLPMDWLEIYPQQLATRLPPRYAPFIPNLQLYHRHHVGELAVMGNLPSSESRPPVRFTTDSRGFRATPAAASSADPEVIVFEGDSFTFGAALSDDETFPASLGRHLGVNAYNGGRFFTDPERLVELDWLLANMVSRPRTLVFVLVESLRYSLEDGLDRGRIDSVGRRVLGDEPYLRAKDELRYLNRFFAEWWPISPLQIETKRLFKRLSNDRILPNAYRQHVRDLRLPDGHRFLFEQRYIDGYLNPPDQQATRRTADYMAWFRDEVRARGLGFAVVLVPEALSVYGPWLLPDRQPPPPAYLDRLERELGSRGITAVNGLEVLRQHAAQDVANGQFAYYRDDHHWNALGVERIAGATAAALKRDRAVPRTRITRGTDRNANGEAGNAL